MHLIRVEDDVPTAPAVQVLLNQDGQLEIPYDFPSYINNVLVQSSAF